MINTSQKANAYEKKIHFHTNIGDFKKAYATGSEVLDKIFHIKPPPNPPKPALIINMLKTKSKFKGQPKRDFVNHKTAEDDDIKMAVKLMAAILKSAYQIKPELAVANALEPLDQQKSILDERIESWKGQESQVDDVLVIGFRYDPQMQP